MPEQQTLRIEGLAELIKALDKLPQEIDRAAKVGMRSVAETVRGGLATYPPRRLGVKQAFVSDKQRKGFFAKLHAGEIEVPYKRGVSPGSERLGASWTRQVKTFGSGNIKGIVGTRASYAPLVQGEEQTAMHQGTGWKTVQQVLDEKKVEIERQFSQIVQRVLEIIAARGR